MITARTATERVTLALLGVLSAGFIIGMPQASHAQTCSPPCAEGTICAFIGVTGENTTCVVEQKDGTVSEVVVTASKREGMSFRELVHNVIVPLFDKALIPLLYALAFILFLIGVVRYFFMGGEEARTKGKSFMLWGIIG
ncbi:MAG TPA: hypothetical protein VFY28_02650, partial [Candidatus Paceibacterota bacterium]|nr:hypothetical protein [Candidatus Paceibacterota bacterium]